MPPLEQIRQLMGPAPRTFRLDLEPYLKMTEPTWLASSGSDELRGIYKQQDRLRRQGRVIWAAVVQANRLLFEPGPSDHPASVIWSLDPVFDLSPQILQSMGPALYQLKGTDPADAEAADFARMLTNEKIRVQRLKVPSSFSGGRQVFHSSVMVVRKHLPSGYLAGMLLPVWADPQGSGLAAYRAGGILASQPNCCLERA